MRGSRTTSPSALSALSIVTLTAGALLLSGCSTAGDESASTPSSDAAMGRTAAGAPAGAADSLAAGSVGDGTSASGATATGEGLLPTIPTERAVIATAEMTLRSDDVPAAVDAIEQIASSAGGFVSARDISSNPDDPKGTRALLTVRVPTNRLESVIDSAAIEGDVVRVTSDEQDVTETVVDVDSRVESARASVERIRSLLSQATTIGEVVRIESELSRREADLESLLAQQRSLANQTSMATLSVTVLAPDAVEPVATDDTGFLPGLERGWNALIDVVVVGLTTLGVLLPFLVIGLLILGPIAAAWRRHRQRADGEAAAPGQTPQERQPEPVH